MKRINLPEIIKQVGIDLNADFRWDNRKEWALDLPVEYIDIKE